MGKASPPVLQSKHKGLISTKSRRCSYPGPTQMLLVLTSWQGDWASVPGLCASSHIPLLAPGSVWFLGPWQLAPAVVAVFIMKAEAFNTSSSLSQSPPEAVAMQEIWCPCAKGPTCSQHLALHIFSRPFWGSSGHAVSSGSSLNAEMFCWSILVVAAVTL